MKEQRLQSTISKAARVPLYFLGFILLALLFAYFTFKLLSFSRTVEVPDLQGKSPVEANEILSRTGLNLRIEGEDYDAEMPAGFILRQEIPAGSKVKENRGIGVILSKGPRAQSVPAVVGESIERAEAILLQNGLKITRLIRVHSNSIEKDRVIAQKPEPDERIKEKITLVVSSGPYDVIYYCPDFRGKTQDEAIELAEKLGLKLRTAGSGQVVATQKPRPGTQIKAGDTVDIQLEG